MDIITLIERLSNIREEHGNLPVDLLIDFGDKGQWTAAANDVAVSAEPGNGYVVIIHEADL